MQKKFGIQAGDKIVKINGKTILHKGDFDRAMVKSKGEEIEVLIEREGEEKIFKVKPMEENGNYYMGVYLKMAENNFANNIYYAFFQTGEFTFSVVDNLKMLFTGNVSIDQMMGPVGIGEVVVQTNGFADFIYILAVVSISLGFTNLLPFPPLDGGKVLILLIEAIRRNL